MARVTLDWLYVHDDADHANFVTLDAATLSAPVAARGDVRARAGGRRVAVRRRGRTTSVDVTSDLVFVADRLWLEDHAGAPVMIRDTRGRLIHGVYWELGVTEHPATVRADVAFTVEQISVGGA